MPVVFRMAGDSAFPSTECNEFNIVLAFSFPSSSLALPKLVDKPRDRLSECHQCINDSCSVSVFVSPSAFANTKSRRGTLRLASAVEANPGTRPSRKPEVQSKRRASPGHRCSMTSLLFCLLCPRKHSKRPLGALLDRLLDRVHFLGSCERLCPEPALGSGRLPPPMSSSGSGRGDERSRVLCGRAARFAFTQAGCFCRGIFSFFYFLSVGVLYSCSQSRECWPRSPCCLLICLPTCLPTSRPCVCLLARTLSRLPFSLPGCFLLVSLRVLADSNLVTACLPACLLHFSPCLCLLTGVL